VQARADCVHGWRRKLADAFRQFRLVDREDLRYIYDTRLGEIGIAFFEWNVARSGSAVKVGGDQADHSGCDSPAILYGRAEFGFHSFNGASFARPRMIGVSLVNLLDHLFLVSAAQELFEGQRKQAAAAQFHSAGGIVGFLEEIAAEGDGGFICYLSLYQWSYCTE